MQPGSAKNTLQTVISHDTISEPVCDIADKWGAISKHGWFAKGCVNLVLLDLNSDSDTKVDPSASGMSRSDIEYWHSLIVYSHTLSWVFKDFNKSTSLKRICDDYAVPLCLFEVIPM